MRILIVGYGWTGRKVFEEFQKYKYDKLHVTSHHDVYDALETCDYDWVINCAGVTGVPNVDACEDDKWTTLEGNILFPIRLRKSIAHRPTRFAHFSSGCIYEGNIDSVDTPPNFFGSTYSVSKAVSDTHLKEDSMVFRIRMPFTGKNEPKNFLTKVKYYAENGNLYNGGQNSLTNHDEAVSMAVKLVVNGYNNGAYNLVNQGSIDLPWIVSKMKLSKEPSWITRDDFESITKCKRSNCVIPAYHEMSDVTESLERAIYEGGF